MKAGFAGHEAHDSVVCFVRSRAATRCVRAHSSERRDSSKSRARLPVPGPSRALVYHDRDRRIPYMALLYHYLRQYKGLIALALVLATINQVFSLLDPLIFRHVIDEYATRFQEYTTGEFFRGVSLLLGAAVGVAFVSRVAKNFQDYYINVITQRLGAQLYSDGIRHSLELPVLGLRGPAQRRNARQAAEGPHRRRAADHDRDQRAVHVARRHRLRDDLRLQRPLAHRAGLLPDRAAARAC